MKLTTRLIAGLAISSFAATFVTAATVEIDPADPIPGDYQLEYEANFDTDGDTEGWSGNAQVTLDAGTPTGGELSGTTTGGDPYVNIGGLSIATSPTTIIEFALTRPVADTSSPQLFYADESGGISEARQFSIGPLTSTGSSQVVRITTANELVGDLATLRLDFSSTDAQTFSIYYVRVYSIPPADALDWDPTQSAGAALGGDGTWDTTSTNFWNGSAQQAWPAASNLNDFANFGGTAGTVTIDAAGVTANRLEAIADYAFTGGALTFDGIFPTVTATSTTFDVPLINSSLDPVTFLGNTATFSQTSTNTGSVILNHADFNLLADSPFGTGSLTTKTGNIFISAVDAPRTLASEVIWKGNRLIVNNQTAGSLPGIADDLIIDGNFRFEGTSPSDIFLRNDLTLNGVVSGNATSGRALWLRGDSGVLSLNNTANTFGGGTNNSIQFNNSSLIEAESDGSLGDASNFLQFAAGNGAVFFKNAESFARDIQLDGNVRGDIGTDTTLTFEPVGGETTEVTTTAVDGTPSLGTFGSGTINLNTPGLNLQRAKLVVGNDVLNVNQPVLGALETEFGVTNINADFTNNVPGINWRSLGSSVVNLEDGDVTGSFLTQIGVDSEAPEMAVWNMNGGTFGNAGELLVGWTGPGTLNINNSDMDLNFLRANDDEAASNAASVINFNGGTTRTRRISGAGDAVAGASLGTWVFNGGRIIAKANPTSPFMYNLALPYISNGGAILDSNGNDIEARVDFTTLPDLGSADGGITKLGEGTLLLSGTNTYTGPTDVDAGCVVVATSEAVASSSLTFVADGAAFGGQVGTGGLDDAGLQDLIDNVNWSSGSSLIIDTNGEDVTVAANITGDIGLIKKGEGELTLTGTNTFTGDISVEGGSITGFNPDASIAIDSVARSGTDFTINFTAEGNVDVYRSSDLQAWGTAIATDTTSPFTDTGATGDKFFYVLVPTGETYPPAE